MIQVSIIVCCYNSAHLLKDTLAHLSNQQTIDDLSYEVVLVDNNSSDQTGQVAKNIWIELNTSVSLTVVRETTPGLSYARKKGVYESKGDFLIFCDDDNWLDKNYIQIAYSFMVANPDVGALGGLSIGKLEIEEPVWWQFEQLNYAVGKQAIKSGDISKRGYVWGAGFVLRRNNLMKLYNTGFASLLSDRNGTNLSSGGDSEICKWVLLMGYKLWYLDSLRFIHYITENRLTDVYLIKLKTGHQNSQKILKSYDWYLRIGLNYNQNSPIFYKLKRSIKLIIKGFFGKDQLWREKLQLICGLKIKVHPIIYNINKTYLLVKS